MILGCVIRYEYSQHTTYEVLKKRAERFGTSVSTLMEKVIDRIIIAHERMCDT